MIPAPRVTIAIPVYNSAATLTRCIRSAMQQTMRDIEILVADDCSTDDSAAVAEALAAEGIVKPLQMLGLPDRFIDHGDPQKLLASVGLDAAGIVKSIRALISE